MKPLINYSRQNECDHPESRYPCDYADGESSAGDSLTLIGVVVLV